jgi:hypothetical protein
MEQSNSSGKATRRTGIALIVVGVLIGLVLRFVPARDWNEALTVFSFMPLFLIVGGAFMVFRGKQRATQARAETVFNDGLPDVLYLRPFKSDASMVGRSFAAVTTVGLVSGLATEEEQLAEVLKPIGDLVAIAHPGKSVPNPGAVKLHASDEEWQQTVIEQMRAAKLVIIRAGDAPGVLWELQQARQLLNPRKLLLLIMAIRKKEFERFRVEAENQLDIELSDWEGLKELGGRAGFFRFRDDWSPEFLPMRAPLFRRSRYKLFRSLFTYALKPVFADYGLEWKEPPISKLTVVSFSILGLFGVLILAVLVSAVA